MYWIYMFTLVYKVRYNWIFLKKKTLLFPCKMLFLLYKHFSNQGNPCVRNNLLRCTQFGYRKIALDILLKLFTPGCTALIKDHTELSSWGEGYVHDITLALCGWNHKCRKAFAVEDERATVQNDGQVLSINIKKIPS
jgi:hypothetical protein